jgi:L,D-transpeptidase YcbB
MFNRFGVRRLGVLALACSTVALTAISASRAAEDVAATPLPPPAVALEAPAAAPVPATPSLEALPPGETPVPVAVEAPKPEEPAPPVVAAQPLPASDPLLIAIRDRLQKPAGIDKADHAALVAFYGARSDSALWIKDGAFTAPAQAAMAAIGNADDWGLSAKAFALPKLVPGADTNAVADAEVGLSAAALKYARQASGGRVDPSTLSRFNDQRGTFANPSAVLAGLAATDKPGAYLEALHPKHPQFHKLREALLKVRHGGAAKEEPAAAVPAKLSLAAGPSLKPGAEHADVALIRAHLGVPAAAGSEAVYDKALVGAVKSFQQEHGLNANGVLSSATRTALNGGQVKTKAPAASDPARDAERIALNMERWRWLPADMGAFHIQNNVPEYMTRVFKNGAVVHQEKIIVGKTNTPTSVFSANMQFVIFHPEWGVPDSIKMKEILPSLRRKTQGDDFFGLGPTVSDTRVLQRHNLRVSQNGRVVDASQIDWTKTDPRAYQFIQPAGGTNVLGVVKFRFPNRHDIYMHDTPQRDLFAQTTRTFSHGCMRVNNPRRLAEVILAEERGWTPDRVGRQIDSRQSLEVKLEKQFPVHVTYFTARVDETGKLNTFADIYGHDAKLAAALAGRPVPLEQPSTDGPEPLDQTAERRAVPKKGAPAPKAEASLGGLLQGLFGN